MFVFCCSILADRLPLNTVDGNASPQLTLPLKDGVEPQAIKMILSVSHTVYKHDIIPPLNICSK